MNTILSRVALLLVCAVGATGNAMATRIKANSPESGKAFSNCAKNGGANWTQSESDNPDNLTYGCVDKNGHGLVCGGGTVEQKNSCDTFRTQPPFPSREDVLEGAQSTQTDAQQAAEADAESSPTP